MPDPKTQLLTEKELYVASAKYCDLLDLDPEEEIVVQNTLMDKANLLPRWKAVSEEIQKQHVSNLSINYAIGYLKPSSIYMQMQLIKKKPLTINYLGSIITYPNFDKQKKLKNVKKNDFIETYALLNCEGDIVDLKSVKKIIL